MAIRARETDTGTLTATPDGYRDTREWKVTGLNSGPAPLRRYLASLAPGVPQPGSPHPTVPGLVALEVTVDLHRDDNRRAMVRASYGVPEPEQEAPDDQAQPTITVGSNVTQETTQKDKDGNQLQVSLTTSAGTLTQNVEAQIQAPQSVIEYRRREGANPLEKSLEYTGAVNNKTVGPFRARTLLCRGVRGDSDDNGSSYLVTYSFEYRPTTWDATLAFIDDDTDKVHEDATLNPSNGIETGVRLYPEADFRRLNIF